MESAKKRIQKLKAAGLLRERPRKIGTPSFLHITKRAFLELQTAGHLDSFSHLPSSVLKRRGDVSELTLKHELEVMDVRCAFENALREHPSLILKEFSTWPALHEFSAVHLSHSTGRRQFTVRPDGFIRVHEQDGENIFEHLFFLEVDRSTESQGIIAQKGSCYLNFYQSGGMAERLGGTKEEYREFPFRTLMVFRSEERRNNAAERMLVNNPPTLTLAWLTTLSEIKEAALADIWLCPLDLLDSHKPASSTYAIAAHESLQRSRADRKNKAKIRPTLRNLFVPSTNIGKFLDG